MVDPRDAIQLYRAAHRPKQLWMVPEADHCGAYFEDRATYIAHVVGFFQKHLTQTSQGLPAWESRLLQDQLPHPIFFQHLWQAEAEASWIWRLVSSLPSEPPYDAHQEQEE
jgi:hypothetical protein